MTVITTDTSTALSLTSNTYTILEGVTHYEDAFTATVEINNAANATTVMNIMGTVLAVYDNAIEEFSTGAGDLEIRISSTGSLIARLNSLYSDNDDTEVQNDGYISGRIYLNGTDATVLNTGTITQSISSYAAVYFTGSDGAELFNTGTITSAGFGVWVSDSAGSNEVFELQNSGSIVAGSIAIYMSGSTFDLNLVNSGLIQAGFGHEAIANSSTASDVTNTGEIIGDIVLTGGALNLLDNHGTITGDVSLGGASAELINTGEINGDVILSTGADTFDGRGGTINGYVDGGAGDDTYIIDDGTIELIEALDEGTDTVQTSVSYALGDNFENLEMIGGEDIDAAGNDLDNVMDGNIGSNNLYGRDGEDAISGGDGNDMIKGGAGDDTLNGDDGNDILYGGTDNDRLFGGGGNDILEGRRGVDRLYGGDGDDVLDGAAGNDLLNGGDGDDFLDGGEGLDKMYGGDGSDTFIWHSASESKDSGKADQIYDFETGVDQLDFVDIMSGDFDLNIGGSLTGGGTASIMTVETGGDTEIFADVDGDGVADMRVDLVATLGVTEVDFIV